MKKKSFNPVIRVLVVSLIFCCLCSKKKEEAAFAKVGGKVISQESFEVFKNMRRFYPGSNDELPFPGDRSVATLCVEVEALYPKAKSFRSKVVATDDWKWKTAFFPAQLYLIEILDKNLGFADKVMEDYYNQHKEDYKKIIKVQINPDTAKKDTSSTASGQDPVVDSSNLKDSVIYRPLNAARGEIAQKLFIEKYPPDSAFYTGNADSTGKVDSADVNTRWVMQIRRGLPDFFMRKIYKKNYGKEYPENLNVDSANDIYGEGKIITPADLDVIFGWLPPGSRQSYQEPERKGYLIGWLLKWRLFSDEAKLIGFDKNKDVTGALGWAEKFDVVASYVNGVMATEAEKNITVDTALCVFEHWDRSYRPEEYPDSATIAERVKASVVMKKKIALDAQIYAIRTKAKVQFLQSDYTDNKIGDPAKLASEADSLYANGKSSDAESIYRKLVDNFLFSDQGKSALVELAKILTEGEKYGEAIERYRQSLQFSTEQEKQCNIFFMIGFVYSEYLNRPELAEVNYKWVLKNTPGCDLADDAEFMCLHLDEPMIGVDELQDEARRQGRKVENQEPVSGATEEKASGM